MEKSEFVFSILNKVSILLFCVGALVMSESSAKEHGFPVGEGFGLSSMNVMPDGANDVGVWLTGIVHVGLSNTLSEEMAGKLSGTGVVEARLSPDDLAQAKSIHSKLCEAARDKPSKDLEPMRPPMVYWVTCVENNRPKPYQGQLHELPRDLAFQFGEYQHKILKHYADQGHFIVKLDVVVADLHREHGKLLVSVRFVNGGQYPIQMSTPDKWSRQWDRLGVGAIKIGDDGWGFELVGVPLVNQAEFPDESLIIPAHGSVSFSFLVVPDKRIKRGTYRIGALAIADIGGEGVAGTMGRVGFTSDNSKAAIVTFDRDYPSTPEELENYEAQKRETMSSKPEFHGSEFGEDDCYGAISVSNDRRILTHAG
jgi:hypothetical protein